MHDLQRASAHRARLLRRAVVAGAGQSPQSLGDAAEHPFDGPFAGAGGTGAEERTSNGAGGVPNTSHIAGNGDSRRIPVLQQRFQVFKSADIPFAPFVLDYQTCAGQGRAGRSRDVLPLPGFGVEHFSWPLDLPLDRRRLLTTA